MLGTDDGPLIHRGECQQRSRSIRTGHFGRSRLIGTATDRFPYQPRPPQTPYSQHTECGAAWRTCRDGCRSGSGAI